jgi:hypothetical protein
LRYSLWDADRGCLVSFRAAGRRASAAPRQIFED